MILQWLLQTMLDLIPRALIQRFFLAPDYFIYMNIRFEQFLGFDKWEGIKLLDANQRKIIDAVDISRFKQIKVDIPTAEDEATRVHHV